ncbi:hypothetical protein NLU66_03270 [Brachybacterium sp. NBEC-018]|uniref:hypothetical protein n=1 Tax=Brachybacterium sp. NBEC-018 TaxID=2996004 RepID=UPI00217535D3|nr:hypothetical protein [Brachybacterium sp. NBEC-018]UVY84633.1 hypothetical protein NLU66_03270 [Brachybacterium sp. NBEC-018]
MAALSDAITRAVAEARRAPNGRHAEVLVHDGPLRQSVIALGQGITLAEHNSPPAASIYVIRGRLRITGDEPVEIAPGQIETLTHQRHAVESLDDTVFLLTTVTSVPGTESYGGAHLEL